MIEIYIFLGLYVIASFSYFMVEICDVDLSDILFHIGLFLFFLVAWPFFVLADLWERRPK